MVGTSDNEGTRLPVLTASGRSLPALISGSPWAVLTHVTAVSPDTVAAMPGAPPLSNPPR